MLLLWGSFVLLLLQILTSQQVSCKYDPAKSETVVSPEFLEGYQGTLVDLDSTPVYPMCLDCLETLALVDLKATFLLLNQHQQEMSRSRWAELSREDVLEYLKDAQGTIDAHAQANANRTTTVKNGQWSEKWVEEIASKTARNSLAAYRLIFRIVRKFTGLIQKSEDFHRTLREHLPATLIPVLDQLPTKTDLLEAALGILRLQLVYSGDHNKMTSNDLVWGKILDVETGVTLDPAHCYHLGVVAGRKIKNYAIALQWLDSALSLTKQNSNQNQSDHDIVTQTETETEFRAKLEREIKDTVQKHNHHFLHLPLKPKDHSSKWYGGKLFPFPLIIPAPVLSHFHHTLEKYLKRFNSKESEHRARMFGQIKRYQDQVDHLPRYTLWDPNLDIYSFHELCAGADLLSEREKLKLFCWNEQKTSPFYLIGPMKMEFISRGPDIVQVYDVLGPKAIEEMMSAPENSGDKFRTGALVRKDGAPGIKFLDLYLATETEFSPKQNVSWNEVFIHTKEIFKISRETFKISKYAYFGHFLPHVDYLCNGGLCDLPERLANFVVYLSDVPLGGYTVFTHSRVFARPIKGSVLFWFNLDGNLRGDVKSVHAGCPSPLGGKIKLGQMVRALPRFKEWKCPLTDRTSFRIKVNGVE